MLAQLKAAYQKAFLEANKDGSELNLDAVKEAYNERQLELDTSMLIENLIPGTYIMDRFGNITVVKSKKDNEVTLQYIIGKEITKENQKDLSENYERITEEETMELEIKPEDQEIAKENIADLKKLGEDKEAIDEAKAKATDSSREDLLKQLKDNSENC